MADAGLGQDPITLNPWRDTDGLQPSERRNLSRRAPMMLPQIRDDGLYHLGAEKAPPRHGIVETALNRCIPGHFPTALTPVGELKHLKPATPNSEHQNEQQ